MNEQDSLANKTKRAWDYYRHADNLYSGRINSFLVAETILLLIFFSEMKFVRGEGLKSAIRAVIGVSGFIYTLSWLYVNYGLSLRMRLLTNEYLKSDSVYRKYLNAANGLPSDFFLTWVLPLVTLVLWLLLMLFIIILRL
jgi:hypothetical protein